MFQSKPSVSLETLPHCAAALGTARQEVLPPRFSESCLESQGPPNCQGTPRSGRPRECRGSWSPWGEGWGPWTAATCGAHTFIYDRPLGSPAGGTPGPDPCPALSVLEGRTTTAAAAATHRGGHFQTLGEASVVKWGTYFCPKIDFI